MRGISRQRGVPLPQRAASSTQEPGSPRHGAGLQRAPSSLPPAGGARRHPRICPWCWGRSARSRDLGAEQGLFLREPGSVRGAGVGRLGAEICPRCWGRSSRSRDLSVVLGPVPLRHSVEGSPPLAGHGEEAVPKGFQRGARRWEEEEEGAGCPRGREGIPQPPSCPRRAGRPGVSAEVRRQFLAGDDAGLPGLGLGGERCQTGDASSQGTRLHTPAFCALLSAGPVLISRSARPEPGSSY